MLLFCAFPLDFFIGNNLIQIFHNTHVYIRMQHTKPIVDDVVRVEANHLKYRLYFSKRKVIK